MANSFNKLAPIYGIHFGNCIERIGHDSYSLFLPPTSANIHNV
jgi:hypothetical protein